MLSDLAPLRSSSGSSWKAAASFLHADEHECDEHGMHSRSWGPYPLASAPACSPPQKGEQVRPLPAPCHGWWDHCQHLVTVGGTTASTLSRLVGPLPAPCHGWWDHCQSSSSIINIYYCYYTLGLPPPCSLSTPVLLLGGDFGKCKLMLVSKTTTEIQRCQREQEKNIHHVAFLFLFFYRGPPRLGGPPTKK